MQNNSHVINNKVVLFIANTRWSWAKPTLHMISAVPILAKQLKDKSDLFILDANGQNYSEKECEDILRREDPKAVLVSALTYLNSDCAHTAMKLVKNVSEAIVTVIGGVYATMQPEAALKDKNVDYAFIGYAEDRVGDFIRYLINDEMEMLHKFPGVAYRDGGGGGVIINAMNSTIKDITTVAEPDYSLIDLEPYLKRRFKEIATSFDEPMMPLITSYGCPFGCSFCAIRAITGKHIRLRTVDSVLAEIEYMIGTHGVRCFSILDDLFLFDRERTDSLLNSIIDRNLNISFKLMNSSAWHMDRDLIKLLKSAGCQAFYVSAESGNDRILKEYVRKPVNIEHIKKVVDWAREEGVYTAINWIIGFPGETWDEVRNTCATAEYINGDYNAFNMATPLPKTELYEKAVEMGCLPKDFSFENEKYKEFMIAGSEALISSKEFSPFDIKILRVYEWDRINFKTDSKKKTIAKMHNMTEAELNVYRLRGREECKKYIEL